MKTKLLVFILFLAPVLTYVIQNNTPVTIHFVKWEVIVPQALLLFSVLLTVSLLILRIAVSILIRFSVWIWLVCIRFAACCIGALLLAAASVRVRPSIWITLSLSLISFVFFAVLIFVHLLYPFSIHCISDDR